MTRCTTIVFLVAAAACGCRGGDRTGPASARDGGPELAWAASWTVDDVPDREIGATLKGLELDVVHVQVNLESDATVIEIMDRPPAEACGHAASAQGFIVKLPERLDGGDRLSKSMDEHPRGWSAYMVTRGEDGSAVSSLAQGWSFALVAASLDGGEVRGRMALSFDDAERSGVAGRFTGGLCGTSVP